MEVILLQDKDNLGYADDVVSVKPGYARNYLIPQKIAVVANATNMAELNERNKQRQRKEEQLLSQIQDIKDQLSSAKIKVGAKVGTTDKIFGSVTTHHLAEAIKDQVQLDIDRRKINIEEDVKSLGEYTATINLGSEHEIAVKFEVVAE